MVYGRNLETLKFGRKLTATKVPTVEVRCYDPREGRTRWARYPVTAPAPASGIFGVTDPPRPSRANEVPPSGSVPDDKIETFTLEGINDPATLARAAASIWEQIGRQELEGSLETHDAWSWDKPVASADLLRAKAGDAIELLVASADPSSLEVGESATDAQQLAALTRQGRAAYLQSIGWSEEVAQRFAALQDATQFQTIFRVKNVQLGWDAADGLKVAVEFINFLEIRETADQTAAREAAALEEPNVLALEVTELIGDPTGGGNILSLEETEIVGDAS